VAERLSKSGYTILMRNYRTPFGEVDLIARDGDTIVFVEVKARTGQQYGDPKYAVDRRKQTRLSKAALLYLKDTGQTRSKARFDVVTVQPRNGTTEIEIIRNAFDLAYG